MKHPQRISTARTKAIPGGLAVFDPRTRQFRILNRTSAFVWQGCDGQTPVEALIRALGAELSLEYGAAEKLFWLTVDELEANRLLMERVETTTRLTLTRRQLIRALGAVGLSTVLLPAATLWEPQRAFAATGATGHSNITIVAGSTNSNIVRNFSGSDATYTPTADNAQIGADNIANDLGAGFNVTVDTTNGSGNKNGNITVGAAITAAVATTVPATTVRPTRPQPTSPPTQESTTLAPQRGRAILSGRSAAAATPVLTLTANGFITLTANINNNFTGGDVTLTANGNGAGPNVGILLSNAGISTSGSGAISLTGTGGASASTNYGVQITGASGVVTTVNGDITILADSNGTGDDNTAVRVESSAKVQATGSGTVSITGTGAGTTSNGILIFSSASVLTNSGNLGLSGNGVADGGLVLQAPTTIQTTSGDITLTGNDTGAAHIRTNDSSGNVAVNAGSGNLTLNADDLSFGSATTFSGSGALTVQPRSAATTIGLGGGSGTLNLDDAAIGLFADGFSSITIGKSDAGKITIDSATFTDPLTLITGDVIADANDIGTDLTADTVTVNGTLSPGSSPGVFSVAGNFAFADNSTFNVELTGTPSGGSHDRLDVTGSVTIDNNVTLNLNTGSYTPGSGTITLVNNGSGAVTGTFNGLAEGAQINPGGSPNFTISYVGGDGNDIVLTPASPTAIHLKSFQANGGSVLDELGQLAATLLNRLTSWP